LTDVERMDRIASRSLQEVGSQRYRKLIVDLFGIEGLKQKTAKEEKFRGIAMKDFYEEQVFLLDIVLDSLQTLMNYVPREQWPPSVDLFLKSNSYSLVFCNFDSTNVKRVLARNLFVNDDDSGFYLQETGCDSLCANHLLVVWRQGNLFYRYSCCKHTRQDSSTPIENALDSASYSREIHLEPNPAAEYLDSAIALANGYRVEYKFRTLIAGGSYRCFGFWRKPDSAFVAYGVSNDLFGFGGFHRIRTHLCRAMFEVSPDKTGCPSPACDMQTSFEGDQPISSRNIID
jgi:hypothetical protein